MTRLLVSVRDLAEARLALEGGVDLIDLKEPAGGSLAAVSRSVAAEVVDWIGGRVPTSVACGELRTNDREADPLVEGLSFAKLGMAHCRDWPDWRIAWQRWCQALPRDVAPVAVVYADFPTCGAPAPADVLQLAGEYGCAAVLVDTFDKRAGSLTDLWSQQELSEFVTQVRQRQMLVVLAGSLTLQTLPRVLELGPDFVAVRGAVCQHGRAATLDLQCLAQVRQLVR